MVAPKAFSASSKNAKWCAHQSSEPPCIITVSTTARAGQRSQRSAAVRGRAGFLSSEAFISTTPPRPSGDFFDINCGSACLLYTSDAADDLLCVDLGGRRIIKKKKIR